MAVLDSSFLIDLERGLPAADALLEMYRAQGEPLIVPAMAAAEIIAGSTNALVAFSRLRLAFDIAPMGPDEIMETARLARLAIERRIRPRWPDLSIGAVAMLHATHVVTANPQDLQAVDVPTLDHRTDEVLGAAA